MQNQQEFWDNVAPKYVNSKISNPSAYEETLRRTQSYLKATDTLLELGCGSGMTARKHAPFVAHVTATDISPAMVEIAQERAEEEGVENITCEVSEITEGTYEGRDFDVVLALNLLHLVPDQKAAIAAVRDSLKPGGLFISKTICRPQRGGMVKFTAIRVMIAAMQLFGRAPFVKISKISDYEQKLTDAGFTIIETGDYPAKPPNHFVVARKD